MKQLIYNTDKHYSLLVGKMRQLQRKKEFKTRKLISPAADIASKIRKASTRVDISSFPLDIPWKLKISGKLLKEKINPPYCTLFPILLR